MTPERWQQINALFEQALEQPPSDRPAFLERASQGDEELRRRVAAMLVADARAELKVDHLAQEVAAEFLSERAAEPVEAHESETLIGQTIGSYRLGRELGRGGMGKVYLAHDERLDRRVALKLLPANLTGDAARVARFQREARAASALNHPNILTIYDFGQQTGRHYIAAEFIEGRTLRALIVQTGCTLTQALDIAIQVASALAAAHAAGIIHRDIKPENVMLRPDGFVKVLDFGLAKLTESKARDWQDLLRTNDGEDERQGDKESGRTGEWATKPGLVMGTIAYMSPEQAQGTEVDARSDLFSLGVVLYEMLTGERPFKGVDTAQVLNALMGKEPPLLPGKLLGETSHSAASDDLQRIVSRALAKSPDDRYQTAQATLDALKQLRQELEFTAKLRGDSADKELRPGGPLALANQPTSATGQITHVAVKPDAKRRPFRWAVWAALLVTAMLAGSWVWLRGHKFQFFLPGSENSIKALAVLPFTNALNDPQMEYLPDGITESLIGSMSQLPALTVMARSTVFTYKGREVDPRQVGNALKVNAVVTGRVTREGNRLLISAELVDAMSGARLWGRDYQAASNDVLTAKEQLTRELGAALRPQLSRAEQPQAAGHTADSEAYQLFLIGQHLCAQNTRETLRKALDYFNQAAARDPRYALPHAEIALVYGVISSQYLSPSVAMPKAREAALHAIALDERLPEAHLALARIKMWDDWDWPGAERECQRAIGLNPNYADAFSTYAGLLTTMGRFEEARRAAQRAVTLDVLSPAAAAALGSTFYFAHQYDGAIQTARQALELNPNGGYASGMHRALGTAFQQKRMPREALTEMRQAVALSRNDSSQSWLAYVCAMNGRQAEARTILRELEAEAARRHVSPVSIAKIYVGLGNKEQALVWLRKAYEERSDHLLVVGVDPIYDPMRADPRFVEMLRGIGLSQRP